MATTCTRRRYDHRFRRLIHETGDLHLAIRHGVPRSTARGWSRSATAEVVTLDVVDGSTLALEREVITLRERNAKLIAVLRLLVVLTRVSGMTLLRRRVAESAKKRRLLRAVERSRDALSLRVDLRILGLSSSRYHSWKREEDCALDDVSSCPRSRPQQLTAEELQVLKDMATSDCPRATCSASASRRGRSGSAPRLSRTPASKTRRVLAMTERRHCRAR